MQHENPGRRGAHLAVPRDLRSSFSDLPADFVHLLLSEVACERVVFSSFQDPDPGGYPIPLKRLRRDPQSVAWHLSRKRVRPGHRPADEMLAEALRGAAQD